MNLDDARNLAVAYLEAMEARDLDKARKMVADKVAITFPGGRRFAQIDEIVRNSSGRYRSVRKNIARKDAWQEDGVVCVLVTGTLFGEWPDGTPFEGIRFADRFEIVDGRITRQEVWNDAGERVLSMRHEAAA
ncbi:nuclear transport factor 2 family protein [Afifella pfennigii]|uniref:nuclear transport factor 2 family protein n=1 Tax=Afifella pfennigii TaxID=209897 RepID=UPI0005554EFC|nr:nuclear transport factor 2 family protein [Afifella pfennigii]